MTKSEVMNRFKHLLWQGPICLAIQLLKQIYCSMTFLDHLPNKVKQKISQLLVKNKKSHVDSRKTSYPTPKELRAYFQNGVKRLWKSEGCRIISTTVQSFIKGEGIMVFLNKILKYRNLHRRERCRMLERQTFIKDKPSLTLFLSSHHIYSLSIPQPKKSNRRKNSLRRRLRRNK